MILPQSDVQYSTESDSALSCDQRQDFEEASEVRTNSQLVVSGTL